MTNYTTHACVVFEVISDGDVYSILNPLINEVEHVSVVRNVYTYSTSFETTKTQRGKEIVVPHIPEIAEFPHSQCEAARLLRKQR